MNSVGTRLFAGQTFFDTDGVTPLTDGYVVTKLAGLATLCTTYADVTLSTPNPNSLTLANTLRLDSSGQLEAPMYADPVNGGLAAVQLDVFIYNSDEVLTITIEDYPISAPSGSPNLTSAVIGYGTAPTLTISGGSITPTLPFHQVAPEGGSADNLDTIAVTNIPEGMPFAFSNTNASAAITIRHNVGNIQTYNAENIVINATRQVVQFIRRGSTLYQLGGISSSLPTSNDVVNGRLTLTSGVPVPVADQTGALTLIYFTPYKGESIDLYNPSLAIWQRLSFSELAQAVPASADGNFDVFAYSNSGVVGLWCDISEQWTNATTRSVSLTLQDGVLVKAAAPQYRYLGTITTSSVSGRAIDTYTERKVYNYYNRVKRPVRKLYGEATWSYNTAAYENWNGAAGNGVAILQGWQEDAVELAVQATAIPSNADQQVYASIAGTGSTTPISGVIGQASGSSAASYDLTVGASLVTYPALGLTTYNGIFRGSGTGTVSWQGVSAALIQSGIYGSVMQ